MHEKSKYFNRKPAYLLLKNGVRFNGYSFGANVDNDGELVFQTGMTGYVESLTDPSYKYQILVLTYPLIGNCGVSRPGRDEFGLITYHESEGINCAGLIVGEYSEQYSHWNAMKSLSEWLIEYNVPAICGIDTRRLTKYLSVNGSSLAKIICSDMETDFTKQSFFDPNLINLNNMVSVKMPKIINPNGKYKVAVVDFGIKTNMIRILCQHGACMHLLPWDYSFDINDYDGLFLSNGPGDPMECVVSRENVRKWITSDIVKPVFGICYGHQILGLAAGFRTYKMKYGNRGLSVPCTLFGTKRCFMTTQNHGFSVEYNETSTTESVQSLNDDWDILFLNENDRSNEGIIHKRLPYYSVQFHPEHTAGPKDVEFLFKYFIEAIDANLNNRNYHLKSELFRTALDFTDIGAQPECFRPKKLLLLGSGPLSIGQAAEFDYSGSQAIKAFKEEKIYVVLVNPNVATIQTSKGLADKVYFLPITPEYVTQVIKAERPDAISLSFGGSVALNCGVQLYKMGILNEFNVKVLGTTIDSVVMTEDREEFARQMSCIGEKVVPCEAACTVEQAVEAAEKLGYPCLIRSAYASGGLDSSFVHNKEELIKISTAAFMQTNQILIDKSLKGWKEVEFEVVRDSQDNCITVCSMENVDPLGIHTGESIVCVPCQTLSNEELYMLRSTALKVIRRLGIVGECNIQYALNPTSLEHYIIEVNAHLSRSSALASKSTGYPLAYIAAKLSLGVSLVDIKNSVTESTTACFEPALDYCVVKMPRWDLKKFSKVCNKIGSSMKSVGEVMAIGRDFEEAFQKALRMIDDKNTGFDPYHDVLSTKEEYEYELETPTDRRIFVLAAAIKSKQFTVDQLHELTGIDKWFLYKLINIIEHIEILEENYRIKPEFYVDDEEASDDAQKLDLDRDILNAVKRLGFSDKQIALYVNSTELEIRRIRKEFGIVPYVKQIDTVAAEYPAHTNYLYLTYNADSHDIVFEPNHVIVVGSGVYRIGSSVEFDWCSVSCLRELRNLGYKTDMINFNPSNVSTDYDMCDRLFFEEISFETVMNIYEFEDPKGVILSMGGQTALNIALNLHLQKVKVLGTSPVAIDNSENRYKFSRLLDNIGIMQPPWSELQDLDSAIKFCNKVGYPCLVRSSYVISGASMKVVYNQDDLTDYLKATIDVSKEHPVVITQFISDAKEVDVDAVAKDGIVLCMAIASHVENAGVHSGDATLITPPSDLKEKTIEGIKDIVNSIASALQINGPFNLQLLAKDNNLQVIECNCRVARSFPFVSKTLEYDFIAVATQVAMGLSPPAVGYLNGVGRIGVRVPQFSFRSLTDADVILGVDMASTGEVACFGEDINEAYLKALISTGFKLPKKNIFVSIGSYKNKTKLLNSVKILEELGYSLYGSRGTANFYTENHIKIEPIDWFYEDSKPETPKSARNLTADSAAKKQRNVADCLKSGFFDLVLNVPVTMSTTVRSSSAMTQGYYMRRMAVNYKVPLITNIKNLKLFVQALKACHCKPPPINTSIDCLNSVKWFRLPGLIDVHVTLDELTDKFKDNISSGTSAALAGGYTMILATANAQISLTDENSLNEIEKLYAINSFCDYGLYMGATSTNATSTIANLESRTVGLQVVLNDSLNGVKLERLDDLLKHFQNWPANSPICCNAQGQSLAAILFLSELFDRHVHVSGVSTKEDIYLIKAAKNKGLKVTCSVAVHHLFLSQDNSDVPAPLKTIVLSEVDRLTLWDNLDVIDIIASDHSSYVSNNAGSNSESGFPALETALILMLTAIKQGRISLAEVIEKMHTNPCKIFNLPEQNETFIDVELDVEWNLPSAMPFSKCAWTPYAGMKVNGKVHRVTLYGEVVYVDGNIFAKPGSAKNIAEGRRKSESINLADPLRSGGALKRMHKSTLLSEIETGSKRTSETTVPQPIESTLDQLTHATNGFYNLSLITVDMLKQDQLHDLFNLAHNLRTALLTSKDLTHHLRGKILAEMFYESNVRTQCSFAAAMKRLGGSLINLDVRNSSNSNETLNDAVRMMSSYADCIVMTHPQSGTVGLATKYSNVPVINAGDGTNENPTQALLDIFTMLEEIGKVNGITITMVGDLKHERAIHSLAKLLALYNVTLRYVSPHFLKMPKEISDYLNERNIVQEEYKTIEEALATTDVLYMTRIKKEYFETDEEYNKAAGLYSISPKLMRKAKEKMIVMHSLPRGDEISTTFDSDPRAAYVRQAEYGLEVRMALILSILKDH